MSFHAIRLSANRPRLLPMLTGMLSLLLCGCSSFNREWNQAACVPPPLDSPAGRWEGRWLSAVNGHNGRLRCLVTPQTNETYTARFQATYKKVLRFGYTIPLTMVRSNDFWHFRGEADLGKLAGGIYACEGTATAMHFHSTYRSKYDHGEFELTRPTPESNAKN